MSKWEQKTVQHERRFLKSIRSNQSCAIKNRFAPVQPKLSSYPLMEIHDYFADEEQFRKLLSRVDER